MKQAEKLCDVGPLATSQCKCSPRIPIPRNGPERTGEPQKNSLIHSTVMATFHLPGTVLSARDTTVLLCGLLESVHLLF